MRTKLGAALLALAVAFPVLISCSMPASQAEEPKNKEVDDKIQVRG